VDCGIIGSGHPGMDMISFGPNIRGAHSPDEAVQITSVQRFWHLLTAALERLEENRWGAPGWTRVPGPGDAGPFLSGG